MSNLKANGQFIASNFIEGSEVNIQVIASYYGNNAFRAVSFAESITTGAKLYANGQMQVTEFVEQ